MLGVFLVSGSEISSPENAHCTSSARSGPFGGTSMRIRRMPRSAWWCPMDGSGSILTRSELGPSLVPSGLRPTRIRSISARSNRSTVLRRSRGALQRERLACLFDDVFGLVVRKVILAPKLGCLADDLPKGVRFSLLTANFRAVGAGVTAWHATAADGSKSPVARKAGRCWRRPAPPDADARARGNP